MRFKGSVLTMLLAIMLLNSCSNKNSNIELSWDLGNEDTSKTTIDISEWSEVTPPEMKSDEWYEANHSKNEWKVDYSDSLKVREYTFTDTIRYEISDGIFEGINHGEWGGNLLFYPDGEEGKKYKVVDGNMVGFYQLDNKIYALEGSDHLGMFQGSVMGLKI